MKNFTFCIFLFFSFPSLYAQNCTVNAGLDKTVCVGATFIQEGNIGGSYNSNTLIWTQVSGPGVATITNNTSLSSTISNLVAGNYVFRISVTCQIGGPATDDVNITVLGGATVVTPFVVGWVNGSCYTPGTPINLTGIAPPGHTLNWTASSSTGLAPTFNGNTLTSFTGNSPDIRFGIPPNNWCTINSTNTINITVTSTNTTTGCSVQRTVQLTFKYNLGAVNAWSLTNVCGSCVDLLGSCPQGGAGVWTVVSSPGGAPPVTWSPSANVPFTRACNLITGSYTFRWTVSGAVCVTGFRDLTVNMLGAGAGMSMANAGTGRTYCAGTLPSVLMLEGNIPQPGETVQWTQLSGAPATIANANLPVTTVSGITEAGAPYMFIYSINAGGVCTTYDTVYYSVSKPISIVPQITSNYCGNPAVSSNLIYSNSDGIFPYMFGDSLVIFTTYESGPGFQISHSFSILYDNFTNLTPPIPGTYTALTVGQSYRRSYTKERLWPVLNNRNIYVYNNVLITNSNTCIPAANFKPGVYTIKQEIITPCSTIVRRISVNVSLQGAITTAGSDQVLPCNQNFSVLAGNILPCMYSTQWATIRRPVAAIDPINAGNFTNPNAPINSLVPGIYEFVWYSNSGPTTLTGCPSGSDTVRVLVSNAPPLVPVITGGGIICSNSSININASQSTDALGGTWSVTSVPIGGTYSISPSLNSNSIVFTPTTTNTVYTLTWSVSNGCGNASANTVVTTGNLTSVVPNITNASCQFQGAFGTLTATPSPAPVGVWSSNNPNYIMATPNAVSTTVAPAGPQNNLGAVTFYYTLNNAATGGCGNARDSVTFLPGYSTTTITAANQCNISSFPATIPISFTLLSPYLVYNLYVTGPGAPTLSVYQLSLTGNNYQNATVFLTVSGPGTYKVGYSSVSWGECSHTGSIKSVIISVSNPAPLAIAGPDINLCGNSNVASLNAQPNPMPAGSTGYWSVDQVLSGTTPAISNTAIPNPTITFSMGGSVRLRWTTTGSNADCGTGSVDYLIATYVPAANAGPDDFTCFNALAAPVSMSLSANIPAPANGTWSIISQPPAATPSFVNANMPNTTITGLINGLYTLRWTVTDPLGICPPTTDDINLNVFLGCSVVPVRLLSFTAVPLGNDVKLNWQISRNENYTAMVLERAFNPAGTFTSIGWFTENNTGVYNYTDVNTHMLNTKCVYYRIKTVNSNNEVSYSNVKAVCKNELETIQVTPTIINKGEMIFINTTGSSAAASTWKLYASTGSLLKFGKVGSGSQIPTGIYASGIYFIQVSNDMQSRTFKIVVK